MRNVYLWSKLHRNGHARAIAIIDRQEGRFKPVMSRLIKTLQPHGAREMERRKRQINRGQLKAENGLVA